MKKLYLIIPVLVVAIMFLGCFGGTKSPETDAPEQPETVAQSTESTAVTGSIQVENNSKPVEATELKEVERNLYLPLDGSSRDFYFSSGAGGWRTCIIVHEDGSFTGDYYDGDMGDMSDEYPGGTAYTCKFSGQFENIKKVNDYTYSMTLSYIDTESTPDEWIEDGIRYISSGPYGIDTGEEFMFYLPDAPLSELPIDDMRMWNYYNEGTHTLDSYAIRNMETEQVFFG